MTGHILELYTQLAFRKLGINKDQVMQKRHYEDLGRKLNLFIDYNEHDQEETGLFTTKF